MYHFPAQAYIKRAQVFCLVLSTPVIIDVVAFQRHTISPSLKTLAEACALLPLSAISIKKQSRGWRGVEQMCAYCAVCPAQGSVERDGLRQLVLRLGSTGTSGRINETFCEVSCCSGELILSLQYLCESIASVVGVFPEAVVRAGTNQRVRGGSAFGIPRKSYGSLFLASACFRFRDWTCCVRELVPPRGRCFLLHGACRSERTVLSRGRVTCSGVLPAPLSFFLGGGDLLTSISQKKKLSR